MNREGGPSLQLFNDEFAQLSCDRLVDWLQGYKLPPVGHDDEPYVWILRSIPAGELRNAVEIRIAACLAELLTKLADRKLRRVDREAQVAYNAFMLAAGLGTPEILFEPLLSVLGSERIAGNWLGVALGDALRLALTHNQIDAELKDDWFDLLHQREPQRLRGTPYDAFDGLLLMPTGEDLTEREWVGVVGEALAEFARQFEQSKVDARERFRELVIRTGEARLNPPSLERDLILAADQFDWPIWAVECLPNLYIAESVSEWGDERALMWSRMVFLLPDHKQVQRVRTLCHGVVLEAILSATASRYAHLIATEVEPLRLQNPYFSDRAVLNTINEAVMNLERRAAMSGEEEFSRGLQKKRIELSRELMTVG
jgi:hypothetical protein